MASNFPALVILTSLLFTPTALGQAILRVPEDHPTIQAAMGAASKGDIIDLAEGTWTGQNAWGLSDVTLRGRGGASNTIIDGTGYDWSPVVCFGPCTIEDITFRNGVGSNVFGIVRGGAIYAEFSPVLIRRCHFQDNSVSMGEKGHEAIGGAICSYYAPITITDCHFESNSSETDGGAIFAMYASELIVTDCTFKDNQAESKGGAIASRSVHLDVSNCEFKNNYAGGLGAGIHSLVDANSPGDLEGKVSHCIFTRNVASQFGFGMGGGVAVEGQQVLDVVECEFQDNYGYVAGAAYAETGTIEVSSSRFCGNALDDFYGEVILDNSSIIEQNCWCSADVNNNGSVGADDLGLVLAYWNSFQPDADTDNDGFIDGSDIAMVLMAWERNCNEEN